MKTSIVYSAEDCCICDQVIDELGRCGYAVTVIYGTKNENAIRQITEQGNAYPAVQIEIGSEMRWITPRSIMAGGI